MAVLSRNLPELVTEQTMNDIPNHRKCINVDCIGQRRVFVYPSCPRAELELGHLTVTKYKCATCKSMKERKNK